MFRFTEILATYLLSSVTLFIRFSFLVVRTLDPKSYPIIEKKKWQVYRKDQKFVPALRRLQIYQATDMRNITANKGPTM